MNDANDDRDLREAFAALRREEGMQVTGMHRLLDRAHRVSPTHARLRISVDLVCFSQRGAGLGFQSAAEIADRYANANEDARKEFIAMSRILLLFVLFLASVPGAYAQPSGPDPIAENLFSPEFVMRYAADVGLEEPQRTAIKDALQKAQSRFVDLQWDLQAESGRMVRLLQARPVDEAAVLARADRVMSLEREIKRAHLSLLVRKRWAL